MSATKDAAARSAANAAAPAAATKPAVPRRTLLTVGELRGASYTNMSTDGSGRRYYSATRTIDGVSVEVRDCGNCRELSYEPATEFCTNCAELFVARFKRERGQPTSFDELVARLVADGLVCPACGKLFAGECQCAPAE